ncbi:DUF2244 domain-containing protein [Pseudoduganella sp. LjRoot289]|uniref:DUF2244 domain-containing protein n=1 Tax=Pseudoduganella sp. LjRoot289 TaxID=3342314 RepID=UPI003ECD5149
MRRDLEKREWLWRRNCSLTPRQTAMAYGLLCALSLSVAAVFLMLGVWQVLCFTGVELAAVTAAFLCYARHAADYEHVVLTSGCLLVERVSAGKVVQTQFTPGRTRVGMPEHGGELIALESDGMAVQVGRYAMAGQRLKFASDLHMELLAGRF